jgi:hypothetical protein
LFPFQRSARGALGNWAPALVANPPAAVQAVAAVQETPVKFAYVVPVGVRGVNARQLAPFHCSANTLSDRNAPVAVEKPPTAMHAVAEVQETLVNSLNVSRARLGAGFSAQLVPFHWATTLVQRLVAPLRDLPTAMQEVAEAHETASNVAFAEPVGFGVLCTVQAAPSHRSASVTFTEPGPSKLPTAVQAVGEVQDTAFRTPLVFDGSGTDRLVHLLPFHDSASIRRLPAL